MPVGDALSYFVTVVAIALAPGPVALVLIARSASRDMAGAVGFGLGYALGGLLITGAVCYGLAAWLTAAPELFEVSRYAMLAYMLWIALGVWRGGFDLAATGDEPRGRGGRGGTRALASAGAGAATCLVSPYMMILFPLVLPGMMDVGAIGSAQFAIIAAITFAALMSGVAVLVVFAERIGRLARSARAMTILNRSLAGVLVVAGGWMGLA